MSVVTLVLSLGRDFTSLQLLPGVWTSPAPTIMLALVSRLILSMPCDGSELWRGKEGSYPNSRRDLRSACHLHDCVDNGQDMSVYEEFFVGQQSGVFVEMGGLDGRWCSNTLAFEVALNWRGLLIEGNPQQCDKLQKSSSFRPWSTKLCSAVANQSGQIAWYQTPHPGIAAAVEAVETRMRRREMWHPPGGSPVVVQAKAAPLGELLRRGGITGVIDFFSLDVEGSELAALETMDWTIPVRVWLIEMHEMTAQARKAVRALLRGHGYVSDRQLTLPLGGDEVWMWPSSWPPTNFTRRKQRRFARGGAGGA